ncbi:MAG: nicotinate-nucleotide--dimethylbenzimidazole phosphoribosyltransferase [Candidatus Xenobium sp.]
MLAASPVLIYSSLMSNLTDPTPAESNPTSEPTLEEAAWQHLDRKTMPPRALGALERLAVRIACLQGTLSPSLNKPVMLLAAGDHGVATRGVSFSPREVTWQHSLNLARGGGATGLFCRLHGIDLMLCDVGVDHEFLPQDGIVDCKVTRGTRDLSQEPAMSLQECLAAMSWGRRKVAEVARAGSNVVLFGEMGIGNTTPASALVAALTGLPLDQCVGAGTGMGPAALEHKRKVIQDALALHGPPSDPLEAMTCLGGLELAFMTGGALAAAEHGMLILLDGFIVTSSLLVASRMDPRVCRHIVACHVSAEPAHRACLQQMGLEPLLDLGMRLGEGSGAALAWPLVRAAVEMFNNMTSFSEGGVVDAVTPIQQALAREGL